MSYNVYELYDTLGNVLYVGETKRPKGRLWQHTSKNGRFTGMNIKMHIVATYENRKDAFNHQVNLQEQYGFITDTEVKASYGTKDKTWTWKNKGNVHYKQPIMTCPHCNKSGGKGNMTRYHFDNCKNKI